MTSNDMKALGIRPLDIKFILMLQRIQNHFGLVNQVQLGNHLGYSTKTAERSLRKLKDLGWLVMHRTGSKTWEYEVTEKCPFVLSKEETLKGVPLVDQERTFGRCRATVSDLSQGCTKVKNVCSQDEITSIPKTEHPRLKIVPENPKEEDEILEEEELVPSNDPSKTESDPSCNINNYRIISTVLDTKYYTYTSTSQEVETYYTSTEDNSKKNKLNNYIWLVRPQRERFERSRVQKSIQQFPCKEQDMAEPKITGSDSGSLADLKRRLESGESYFVGKRKKTKSFKELNALPDEFNKEEPAFQEKDQNHFSARKSPEEKSKLKEKAKYNQADMWFVFKRCWREAGIIGNPTPWTLRERANIRELIEEQGSEAIVTYIEYCFRNWSNVAFQCHITSMVPSVPILYGYRRSLLPEALNPKIAIKKQGAEYTHSDVPNGVWGF